MTDRQFRSWEGACLSEYPREEPGTSAARPPKVVDCASRDAIYLIDDARHGVPLDIFNHYVDYGRAPDPVDICDTDPARLDVYGVMEAGGRTVTAYCIVHIPIGSR